MNENDNRTTSKFNREALGLFFELSGWIAIPVVAGLFIGRWLDGNFKTEPILTLVFIGTAFIITVAGIIKKGKKMMKRADEKKDKK